MPGANVSLNDLTELLSEISPAMHATRDDGPPDDATQAALSGYADAREALAAAGRRASGLPRGVHSSLLPLGHSLRILAGEAPERRGQTTIGLARKCSTMLAYLKRTLDQATAAP
jgi:hypothetical protein